MPNLLSNRCAASEQFSLKNQSKLTKSPERKISMMKIHNLWNNQPNRWLLLLLPLALAAAGTSAKPKADIESAFEEAEELAISAAAAGLELGRRTARELDSAAASIRTSRQRILTSTTLDAAVSSSASTSATPATSVATTEGPIDLSDSEDAALLGSYFEYHANMPVITKRELSNAVKQSISNVRWIRDELEPKVTANTDSNDLDLHLATAMFRQPARDQQLINSTNWALVAEGTSRLLVQQFKLNRLQAIRGLPLISIDQTPLGKLCPRPSRTFNCLAGRFRSLSGHCNNVQNSDWGAARTGFTRYAPAHYADYVGRPWRSGAGAQLPSARAVSAAIYGKPEGDDYSEQSSPHMTTMMSFFGQFVFHDLSHVAQFGSEHGRAPFITCCKTSQPHPECLAVVDQNFCLDYVRSAAAPHSGCSLGAREQLNLATSYLDGSSIYSSSEEIANRLRTHLGGRLRSKRQALAEGQAPTGNAELLPLASSMTQPSSSRNPNNHNVTSGFFDAIYQCNQAARLRGRGSSGEENCFIAGDERVNQNLGLTLMHTIWLREHNLLTDQLAKVNKHWRDERLFEEARRILVAELQHITYNEFLPSLLGDEVMQRFNLTPLSHGYASGYDPSINAGVANELAAAVFPFILSTLPNALERYSDRLEMLGTTNLLETFMDASELLKRQRFGQYLMGMMSQNAMEPVSATMPMTMETSTLQADTRPRRRANATARASTKYLPDLDLVALTVQQGRDHGLRSYLYWRRACQLRPEVTSWNDLGRVIAPSAVERLRRAYKSPEHIDLYVALLETPLPGSMLGPTFACLLARQFSQSKHGDRYWYENDLPNSGFTLQQLEHIRQTTMAQILCRNSQHSINFIQPSPMLTSDPFLNAYQYCSNRVMAGDQLDLSAWREPVTTAPGQFDDLTEGLPGNALGPPSEGTLARARRLAEANEALIGQALVRAKRQLTFLAEQEGARSQEHAHRQTTDESNQHHSMARHYRYLPRVKRQVLKINNQSLIFELATNGVVRSLLRQGKDRESAQQSIQADIREFLHSLEAIQLNNLLDNSAEAQRLQDFIAGAGGQFLTQEQRTRLAQANDPTLVVDPLIDLTSNEDLESLNGEGQTRANSVSAHCQDDDRAFPCDHTSQFRTITGWCNNLQHPKFGQSFTHHDRILPSVYDDGLSKPRSLSTVSVSSNTNDRLPLPSARLISTTIHEDRSNLHTRYSLAFMQFGQFGVDHDVTRTPFSVALDGSLLDCSSCDSRRTVNRNCWPISIPENDPHFDSIQARQALSPGKRCLHFVRSINGQTGLGPRQQLNALTAYIDGSELYGSDNCEAKSLRAFIGGRLNVSQPLGASARAKELMPVTRANPECVTPSGFCFHAGDQRASEQPGLTSIHTIFLRLHNSIVGQLAQINRHWNDEKLYQHGRRIVGAILQRITYGEFAPRLLGLDYMSKFDLLLKQIGYAPEEHYDRSCSASVYNEFAAAAFRMGHSLIRSSFPLFDRQFKSIGKSVQLRKAFFNSQRIFNEPSLIDAILRGIVSTPIETLDSSISEELTNHLFEKPKEPFSGMDLISLNIQRARDHGIGPYNRYRAICNLTRARTFEDLSGEIPEHLIKRLSSIYASVDDIDLFTGGMSELPVHGGLIGPTLGCIIGMQLQRFKHCDRFWHETSDLWVRFSSSQLAEIRKMTLARVICQESDGIDTIQRQAMDVPDNYLNPRVPCSSLPGMDLSVWRENSKSCLVNKFKLELGATKRISPCKSCTCTLEGSVCRTTKINCVKAMKQASGVSQVMNDKMCLVQCAWVLDMQPLAAATG